MSRQSSLVFALGILLCSALCFPRETMALDLVLNGETWRVYDDEILTSIAVPRPDTGGWPALRLGEIYPWLESISSLDAKAGENRVSWEEKDFLDWESAYLVKRYGAWELRHGRDIFSRPDQVSVRGTILPIREVVVWDATGDMALREEIEGSMRLRGVDLRWREVAQPIGLLARTPGEGHPDLLVLDHRTALRMADSLMPLPDPPGYATNSITAAFRIGGGPEEERFIAWAVSGSSWMVFYDPEALTDGADADEDTRPSWASLLPGLVSTIDVEDSRSLHAWDAHDLNILIPFLPGGAESLFVDDTTPLPPETVEILRNWTRAVQSGALDITENPVSRVAKGETASLVLSTEAASSPGDSVVGWRNIAFPTPLVLLRGAAVPAGSPRPEVSRRLLADLLDFGAQYRIDPSRGRFPVLEGLEGRSDDALTGLLIDARDRGAVAPPHPRMDSLRQAYNRIGRLILSGQITPETGVELIREAVLDE